jgi:hypothetical protein
MVGKTDAFMRLRSIGFRYVLGLGLVVLASMPVQAQSIDEIASTMKRLSIELPPDVARSEPVRRPLAALARERCDQQAIWDLGSALEKLGYRREAAKAHISFSDNCSGYAPSLRRAANLLLELSD